MFLKKKISEAHAEREQVKSEFAKLKETLTEVSDRADAALARLKKKANEKTQLKLVKP